MINTTIGNYKIVRLIGEGGMAAVYEAEHNMFGTTVAIKVLNPILSANAQIKERFRNEAKLMAGLDHPNIIKVIDFDDQPNQLSIIMEYLSGEDLNQKIKRTGALNAKDTIDIFSQTLDAFQYAHDKGIVHRDIKPSNIFVLPDGRVKILDFGIAKLFGQGNDMTQTGTQMGTPIYMSPEQVKADKSIDHRSDIYSLGVTMYYAVNGRAPYNTDTDSQFDIFNKIVFEPLPDFKIKNEFVEGILKACQKNKADRFQNCRDWRATLLKDDREVEREDDRTIISEKFANKKNQSLKSSSISFKELYRGKMAALALLSLILMVLSFLRFIYSLKCMALYLSNLDLDGEFRNEWHTAELMRSKLITDSGLAMLSGFLLSISLIYTCVFYRKLNQLNFSYSESNFRIITNIFGFFFLVILSSQYNFLSENMFYTYEILFNVYVLSEIHFCVKILKRIARNKI